MSSDRRALAQTFDAVAELYDRARPRYPAEAFDAIAELGGLEPGAHVVEVGAGTGIATQPLVELGFRVTALEPGPSLASLGRRNVPEARWLETSFEDWEPDGPADAVVSATAWHWVEPEVRYRKAAEVARALAVLATHHVGPAGETDPFFDEIQDVYDAIEETRGEPLPQPDAVEGLRAELEAAGLWSHAGSRRWVWTRDYTADSYVDVLETYSGHRAMAPAAREHLYAEIRRRVGDRTIRKHYLTLLDVGVR